MEFRSSVAADEHHDSREGAKKECRRDSREDDLFFNFNFWWIQLMELLISERLRYIEVQRGYGPHNIRGFELLTMTGRIQS